MRASITIVALGLGTIVSTAAAQRPQRMAPATITESTENTVTVRNDRKVPVNLYMDDNVPGSIERLLGQVPASGIATLPLPRVATEGRDSVKFIAVPQGEVDRLALQGVHLQPHMRLTLEVPPWGYTAPASGEVMFSEIPASELHVATITVDNARADAVTVLAENGPFDVPLGNVPAHGSLTMRIPATVVGPAAPFRLWIRPQQGFELSTGYMDVSPGQHLALRIPADRQARHVEGPVTVAIR